MTTTTTTLNKRAASAKAKSHKVTTTRSTAGVYNGYFLLLGLVVVLCSFGLMMVLSASSVNALASYGNSWVFFQKQIIWLAVGSAALFATARIDYRFWRKWSIPLMIISLTLMFFVLVPGVGKTVSGSRRWLGAGFLTMQPSELAKMGILLFSCDLLARREKLMGDWRATTRPVIGAFVACGVLVMAEPDMGTTMVLGAIVITALFVAATPLVRMGKLFGAAAALGTLFAVAEPYRRQRLMSFLHPFNDAGNTGYQVAQSLIGIGSGGIMGVGLGASRAKWGFLPNAHTDFIFAIISEELGLIGGSLVALLFVGFAILGVRAASRAPDQFGILVGACITAWVVVQAFLNIGAVIGILPVTGVPLPFLSQGGTSLVVLMAATGVLLNIARQGEHARRPRTAARGN